MFIPNYQEHFKTKIEAVAYILELLIQNPAIAGRDGTLQLQAMGQFIVIKPIKKKEKV